MKKEKIETESTNKLKLAISIIEEKVAREYGLPIQEVRSKKIEIINSKLTIK